VGTAATVLEALGSAMHPRAEVAVLDAQWPEEVGLHAHAPAKGDMKLVAIGVPDADAVRWLGAGACGCVAPEASLEDLCSALEDVARGLVVVLPEATASLLGLSLGSAADTSATAPESRLTRRELEVMKLVAAGLANKQIAARLSIQEQTVKNHVHNVLVKLDAQNRVQAALLTNSLDGAGSAGPEHLRPRATGRGLASE
jgi:two-component system nitrate/nitrite response regulator NarL